MAMVLKNPNIEKLNSSASFASSLESSASSTTFSESSSSTSTSLVSTTFLDFVWIFWLSKKNQRTPIAFPCFDLSSLAH